MLGEEGVGCLEERVLGEDWVGCSEERVLWKSGWVKRRNCWERRRMQLLIGKIVHRFEQDILFEQIHFEC